MINTINQNQLNGHRILFIDCGAKNSQLTYFLQQGYQVDRINSRLQLDNEDYNIYNKLYYRYTN